MPMYDFYCNQCEQEFEELVARDRTDVPCPRCQGTDTRRLMSRFASLSGSGSGGGAYVPRNGGGCAPGG